MRYVVAQFLRMIQSLETEKKKTQISLEFNRKAFNAKRSLLTKAPSVKVLVLFKGLLKSSDDYTIVKYPTRKVI